MEEILANNPQDQALFARVFPGPQSSPFPPQPPKSPKRGGVRTREQADVNLDELERILNGTDLMPIEFDYGLKVFADRMVDYLNGKPKDANGQDWPADPVGAWILEFRTKTQRQKVIIRDYLQARLGFNPAAGRA